MVCIIDDILNVENVSVKHAELLFNKIDMSVIGNIVSWGVSDTPTRDSIHEFIDDNRELFLKL